MPTDLPTSVYYDGDGSDTDFDYPFPVLHASHVKVSVDGVVTEHTKPAEGTVRLAIAPPAGTKNVRVYRQTQTAPMVSWGGGAVVNPVDLNKFALQSLYLAQEAADTALAALELVDSIPAGPKGDPGNDGDGTGDMVRATYDPNDRNADVFARANHTGTQPISSVTSLQATLDALDTAIGGKVGPSHSHAQGDITGLSSALAGKAAASHSHEQSDVTGLTSALSGKAAASHSHAQSDITGLAAALSGKVTSVNVVHAGASPGAGVGVESIAAGVTDGVLTITATRALIGSGGGGGGE